MSTEPRGDLERAYIGWKGWAPDSFAVFDDYDRRYFSAQFRHAGVDTAGSLLEIGFGAGRLLGYARSTGMNAAGVEANAVLVALARSNGYPAYSTIQEVDSEDFDVVVAFDVLEHVDQADIPQLLKGMATKLSASGRIVLRFPNGDSPFGRRNQHGDVTHLTTIGGEKLRYFAECAELSVLKIANPADVYWGRGPVIALVRGLKRLFKSFVETIVGRIYFGANIPLDDNLLVVLSRKR